MTEQPINEWLVSREKSDKKMKVSNDFSGFIVGFQAFVSLEEPPSHRIRFCDPVLPIQLPPESQPQYVA